MFPFDDVIPYMGDRQLKIIYNGVKEMARIMHFWNNGQKNAISKYIFDVTLTKP